MSGVKQIPPAPLLQSGVKNLASSPVQKGEGMVVQAPVLIMAAGTGGHILPALAVARLLRERGIPVLWLGTPQGMEKRLVAEAGFEMVSIDIGGLRGKGVLTRLKAPFRVLYALGQSLEMLRKYKPRLVLGFGGYVAGPAGVAARLRDIPLVIHEQNALAGLTNRWLARVANKVLAGYAGAFPAKAVVDVVGNPVRAEIAALPSPEVRMAGRSGRLHLLVVGGSLGAQALNKVLPQALALLSAEQRPEVWHQAGSKLVDAARAGYVAAGLELGEHLRVEPFITDMAAAYAWADWVLCRAGALTVAELAAAGVGSVLVPFPHAVDDHQTHNAAVLARADAAEIIQQTELTAQRLADVLCSMTHERALTLACHARAQAQPDAAMRVLEACAPWLGEQIPLSPPFAKGEGKPMDPFEGEAPAISPPVATKDGRQNSFDTKVLPPSEKVECGVSLDDSPALPPPKKVECGVSLDDSPALPPFEKGGQGGFASGASSEDEKKNKEIHL
jgi:UDP-N-acetylglucosamine--N-acetylmuramyl-(pentapeptide) pyrophosphoryl-undecaprenol N-acetylglucosamine transferase